MVFERGRNSGFCFLLTGLLMPLFACGEGGNDRPEAAVSEGRAVQEPEMWRLAQAPFLEIGVREGEDAYQLHRVHGSVLLEDGQVVVLNGGSQELRFFDSEGRFLHSVGGRGEGPGEFRSPAGLRRAADGGFQVWDQSLLRVSNFAEDGTFQDLQTLLATREEMFPGDDWLLGQDWIVSPVPPGARGPIRAAVEALPSPDSVGTLRILRVTDQGRIWSPRQRPPTDDPVEWEVFDFDGNQVAQVTTPPRFLPHEIGEDYLTGLFLDDVDVNYVRIYRLEKPEGSPPGPGLDRTVVESSSLEPAISSPAPSDSVMADIRSLVKVMASLQEINYSEHYTYTTDVDALIADPRNRKPPDLEIDILFAGESGWAGQVSHPESGGRCLLAYGFYVPMGWQPGAIICI